MLGLGLFYFILSLPPLNRHVLCSRLYLGGKNMRKKCQMNNLRETKKFGSCITCLERSLKWYNWDVQGLSQLQHGYLIKKIQASHSCKWELRLPVSIKYSKKKECKRTRKVQTNFFCTRTVTAWRRVTKSCYARQERQHV